MKVVNLVASAHLGIVVDLNKITSLENGDYEPEQFPGGILRYPRHGATALVFKNGKIVIVGCKSEQQIEEILNQIYNDLSKIAISKTGKKPEYKITNIVLMEDLKSPINQSKLLSENYLISNEDISIEYEPEQFPGTIIRISNPLSTALVFRNGKIIISGFDNMEQGKKALKKLLNFLSKYV
jgi:transcription initiation factor TFIID TATA-box-binding protein